jgi:hypothetical protein
MVCYKLLPGIAAIACLLLQADALSSTMEDESLGSFGDFSEASQKEIDADNSMDDVNVTGAWSIDLLGTPQEKMKLYLVQKNGVISSKGAVIEGNETARAIANGSIFGAMMRLTVVPSGVPNLYMLNLSLSSLAGGEYTVHQADGKIRSGKFTFAVHSNIFKPASAADEWDF